jgi:arylsulfatase A-like enzyme
VRNLAWRYNRWGEGPEELYDLRRDPGQFTNLAGDPAYASELAAMRAELVRQRGKVEAGKPGVK